MVLALANTLRPKLISQGVNIMSQQKTFRNLHTLCQIHIAMNQALPGLNQFLFIGTDSMYVPMIVHEGVEKYNEYLQLHFIGKHEELYNSFVLFSKMHLDTLRGVFGIDTLNKWKEFLATEPKVSVITVLEVLRLAMFDCINQTPFPAGDHK